MRPRKQLELLLSTWNVIIDGNLIDSFVNYDDYKSRFGMIFLPCPVPFFIHILTLLHTHTQNSHDIQQ